jgi:Protein of unknown function (DUF3341)
MSPRLYGLAAEFDDAGQLVAAARAAREEGYRRIEAYSPYPISDLDEIVTGPNRLPAVVLAAGITGTVTAWILQYGIAVWLYPLNVGGRPLNSWPSFVVIMFELTVLFAACSAFFGMLFFAGFPALYHPLFRIPRFRRVSQDGFFLCIEARDQRFDTARTARFLREFDPLNLWEVEHE